MRETKSTGWIVQNSSDKPTRNLGFTAIVLGLGLAITAGAARAADDDEEKKSFSEKFIDGIKSSVRGTSIDDGRIEYRERSPLVVPPRLDLPPPDTTSKQVKAPNWPKDPNEGRRRSASAKKKSEPSLLDKLNPFQPSTPTSEVDTASAEPSGPPPPARPDGDVAKNDPVYDRAGSFFKTSGLGNFNLFGSSKPEATKFTSEPERQSLTQPPLGYQTPSSSYAYGVGVQKGFTAAPDHDPRLWDPQKEK
ncbi:MAG TPA: hypothetical protein VFH41_05035 [Bradyrhizobium sp.]|nr:hypothetical protein [Bradyrhizobium sp.]